LEGVESAQAATEAVPNQQSLSAMEMGGGDRHDPPQTGGDIGEEPSAHQVKIGGRDLTGACKPGEDRM
jgi:hypothetical protein